MDTRQRAEAVFESALELEPAERSDYVARVCAYDPALLRQVLSLLGAHARAEGVLDLDAAALMRDSVEPMPERLGAYRIVREIGRGGMGVVYEAERDDGQFLRRVAIKLLRTGRDPALRQRVLAERQILASLEHSDIARLLDGGVTPDGRPYLVMEHVEGLPVDVYCDRMRLGISERLRLFNVIARAVAYAHRNLIVHRDLKPSNILVTTEGQVKLLDFGVAKLLHPAWRGLATQTLQDRLAFTPEYASPEQLRGESLTTVSDVYALGVLLYELLAGRRPFAASALAPLLRAVTEDEPKPPSTRVLHSEHVPVLDGEPRAIDAEAVARARHTTPARLARTLEGDLDAIVMTALAKEPRGRYSSAELLVDDVERYLDDRPVLAQRRGRAYAFGKLIRRHRSAAGAVALGVLSLLIGAGMAIWQAAVAREQRDAAQAARAESEQVTEFMVDLFESGGPGAPAQGVVSARDLVRRGTSRIDALSGQPVVQASLLSALARAYEGLADYEEGQRLTQRALDIHQARPQVSQVALATLLLQKGTLQRQRSQFDSAQNTFLAAFAAVERVSPVPPALHADILQQLASIAVYLGDIIAAEQRISAAYEEQRRELGETHPVTVNTLAYYASVEWRRSKLESEAMFRRVIELREQIPGHTRLQLMQDRMALATMLVSEALRLDEAEAICRSVIAEVVPDRIEQLGLSVWSRHLLAVVLEQKGQLVEAERLRHEDLRLRRAALGGDHPELALSVMSLANFLTRRGRYREADSLFAASSEIIRTKIGLRTTMHSAWLIDYGMMQLGAGDARAADTLVARGVALRAQLSGPTPGPYALGLRLHARVKIKLGEYDTAERMLNEALAVASKQIVPNGRDFRHIHAVYAELYTALGRHEDARRHRALSIPEPIPT